MEKQGPVYRGHKILLWIWVINMVRQVAKKISDIYFTTHCVASVPGFVAEVLCLLHSFFLSSQSSDFLYMGSR